MAKTKATKVEISREGHLLAKAENAKNEVINMLIDYTFYVEAMAYMRENGESNNPKMAQYRDSQMQTRQSIIDFVQRLAMGERTN